MKRVLVANRGEIAVRIIRACHSVGLEAVLAVSAADRDTLGARLADRVVCIGPPPSPQSYLNMAAIVTAAVGCGCDAVHPGYGFLAERAEFARMVSDANLIFVGPSADLIDLMGDKVQARQAAEEAGVPTPPGTGRIAAPEDVEAFVEQYGLPILIKASAGGGGRGMRLVRDREGVIEAFRSASTEAEAAFGDAGVFVERYIERARHIEIQVLGDNHGNVIHLGERECSVQRRYQKLIEEAPSAALSDQQRTEIRQSGAHLANHVGYVGAGTIEFILDDDTGQFFFLEMNTRIQVEHPVTEMVTGIDLVAAQLEIAAGKPLAFRQNDIVIKGHSIECRINAEDALHGFRPSPGRLVAWETPKGRNMRIDTHCYPGYLIPPFYDSLLCKLIVWADDRAGAIEQMCDALSAMRVEGVATTVPFHLAVMTNDAYRDGRVRTRWVEEDFLPAWSMPCHA